MRLYDLPEIYIRVRDLGLVGHRWAQCQLVVESIVNTLFVHDPNCSAVGHVIATGTALKLASIYGDLEPCTVCIQNLMSFFNDLIFVKLVSDALRDLATSQDAFGSHARRGQHRLDSFRSDYINAWHAYGELRQAVTVAQRLIFTLGALPDRSADADSWSSTLSTVTTKATELLRWAGGEADVDDPRINLGPPQVVLVLWGPLGSYVTAATHRSLRHAEPLGMVKTTPGTCAQPVFVMRRDLDDAHQTTHLIVLGDAADTANDPALQVNVGQRLIEAEVDSITRPAHIFQSLWATAGAILA